MTSRFIITASMVPRYQVYKRTLMKESHVFAIIYLIGTLPVAFSASVSIPGAGASFPVAVYNQWMAGFTSHRQEHVSLKMSYLAVGSGQGTELITKTSNSSSHDDILYAGSDYKLKDEYDNGRFLTYPTLAGSVVIGFNIPGMEHLNLSQEAIVGIYNGSVTRWNDTIIQDSNEGMTMENESIIVIARADKSGTTSIFTEALTAFSQPWGATYGNFKAGVDDEQKPIHWGDDVITYFGYGNRGVTGLLLSFRYSIAYLSIAEAEEAGVSYANVANHEGRYVLPTVENIHSAMEATFSSNSSDFTKSLSDANGLQSYPILGLTFIIFLAETYDCDQASEFYMYIEWFYTDPQAEKRAKQLYFAPISPSVTQSVLEDIKASFTCGGTPVHEVVLRKKAKESYEPEPWKLPLYVGSSIFVFCSIACVAVIIRQQIKANRAYIYSYWKISFTNIKFPKTTKSSNWTSRIFANSSVSLSTENVSQDNTADIDMKQGVGKYGGALIKLHRSNLDKCEHLQSATKWLLLKLQGLTNANVSRFFGVTSTRNNVFFLHEFGTKNTLDVIIANPDFKLDLNFKFCISCDVASGLAYLHKLDFVHGNLRSYTCCIDSKWNVKITDWAHTIITNAQNRRISVWRSPEALAYEQNRFKMVDIVPDDLFVAPEHLINPSLAPTKASDVFSMAMLLVEIFTRKFPYEDDLTKSSDIIKKIVESGYRPQLPPGTSRSFHGILKRSWSGEASDRLPVNKLLLGLEKVRPNKKCMLDCMMEALEEYVDTLEDRVEERTRELGSTMQSMQTLLHQILPQSIADKLQKGQTVSAESYENATIFFSDIVSFTTLAAQSNPMQIVDMLNSLYTVFDEILDKHDVYKVETIGDAYMVASGLPIRNGDSHVEHISKMALQLVVAASSFKIEHRPDVQLCLRAGIHTGPVAAGIVGIKMPRYCIFGDTVNTASRMESTSLPMKIQLSETTYKYLEATRNYEMEFRGEIKVKGKGDMKTFWLTKVTKE